LRGKQLILIGTTLVLAAILFYLGYKTPAARASVNSSEARVAQAFNFDTYLKEQTEALPSAVRGRVSAEGEEKELLLTKARLWDSTGNKLISAHYCMEVAERSPDETNWHFAGTKFYEVASSTEDSLMQVYAAGEAERAFQKVLELNPANLDARNALAIIEVQVHQDVMKGVGLLREVVSRDSNNVQAIFTLGMLSIRSGQLDKAEQRFKKLVSLEPFNAEYYFYLGDIYTKAGKKKEAIETYQTCQTLVKDANARKEIQTLINQLKTL
jgi:cytochrome c-type biogenesis protein CcmH/NrfG